MFSKFRVSLQNAWRAGFGKHLLVTNTVSSGGFFVLGDAIQQRLEMTQNPGRKFDFKRNFRLGVVGLTQGPPHHYWYVYLDKFLPGKSYGVVMKKILADQIFAAPFFAITFIFGAGLLEGNTMSKIAILCSCSAAIILCLLESCWREFKAKFPTIYLFDWVLWPPSQAVNFLLVPSQFRWDHIHTD